MNALQSIQKLQAEVDSIEFDGYVRAGKLQKQMTGLSASGDQETFTKIKQVLDFEPSTAEGKHLKANILRKAEAQLNEGMGDGLYFIDWSLPPDSLTFNH